MNESWVRSSGRENLAQAPQTAAQTLLFVNITFPRTAHIVIHKFSWTLRRVRFTQQKAFLLALYFCFYRYGPASIACLVRKTHPTVSANRRHSQLQVFAKIQHRVL